MTEIDSLANGFQSLAFPGRSVLAPAEVSQRLGISLPQVHALIDEGELASFNVASKSAQRKTHRIPIESFAEFIARRSTGAQRLELLRQLPIPAIAELHRDLGALLKGSA